MYESKDKNMTKEYFVGNHKQDGESHYNSIIYGGFWRRAFALIMDCLFIWAPLQLIYLTSCCSEFVAKICFKFMFLGWWLYNSLMISSRRQATYGKMFMGLKVTNKHYGRLTWAEATLRFMCSTLSGLFFGIGYIVAAFNHRKEALHDMLSGSYVIYEE